MRPASGTLTTGSLLAAKVSTKADHVAQFRPVPALPDGLLPGARGCAVEAVIHGGCNPKNREQLHRRGYGKKPSQWLEV